MTVILNPKPFSIQQCHKSRILDTTRAWTTSHAVTAYVSRSCTSSRKSSFTNVVVRSGLCAASPSDKPKHTLEQVLGKIQVVARLRKQRIHLQPHHGSDSSNHRGPIEHHQVARRVYLCEQRQMLHQHGQRLDASACERVPT